MKGGGFLKRGGVSRPRLVSMTVVGICLLFFLAASVDQLASALIKATSGAIPQERYERLTRINPWNATNWFVLARIYDYLGEYAKARHALQRSLSLNCLYYPAWIEHMWLSMRKGAKSEGPARIARVLDLLNPTDTALHWKILIRMLALNTPWAPQLALNEIRTLLPLDARDRTQLFRIAELILGNPQDLLAFVPDEKQVKAPLLSYLLYARRRPDLALTLWEEMKERGWKNEDLFHTLINGLFRNRKYREAFALWKKTFRNEYRNNLVFNGGFERDFLKYGFAWRVQRRPKGVRRMRFIHFYTAEGRRSFTIECDGEHNPRIMTPYQYIYLEPGQYRLSAFLSTREVTSASGFYLELSGPHFRAISRRFTGDTDWTRVELLVSLKLAGMYRVSLRRDATSKLNRFLGGKVFLDEVTLHRLHE